MRLGAHMSIAGGAEQALFRGQSVGCQAIAMFTKNNNQWKAKPLTQEDADRFSAARIETGIHPIVAHTSYLINIGSPDGSLWKKSMASLQDELRRAELLGIPFLVLHPGSHVGKGIDYGIKRAGEAFNRIHVNLPHLRVMTLLEHTAGQGTNLCCTFEEIARLRELIVENNRIGVCLDTCHLFAAGYDFRKPESYADSMRRFDDTVGIRNIKAWHLNDSKNPLGSHVDRHEHIGKGKIGRAGFKNLLNDPRWDDLPALLETPKGPEMKEDIINLRTLRRLIYTNQKQM